MQCPENNNMTFANAYEKLNCLQFIESAKNNETITLILIFLTVTLVIIVVMTLYLIRRRRVRTMKPKHFSQPLLPRITDQNCVFDIFISYAEADWQIMEEIFRNLSNGSLNQNCFKLAFNEKDCIPGKMEKNELYWAAHHLVSRILNSNWESCLFIICFRQNNLISFKIHENLEFVKPCGEQLR